MANTGTKKGPKSTAKRGGRLTNLPIMVAVGASAGGLEAFTELLGALPAELPFCLVLMQHLQAGHPSFLAQILQKATSLPVREAEDNERPLGGHIYVMPPGKLMTLRRGRLRLAPRPTDPGEPIMPIDIFMRSLAQESGSAAIGVILSGTNSDGTEGLLAIKSAGGVCFAQTESTAEYGGMSRSAVSSGSVDYILGPAEIGLELARLARRSPDLCDFSVDSRPEPASMDGGLSKDPAFFAILDLIRRELDMDFRQYRGSTLGRRTARRMAMRGIDSPGEYLRFLREHRRELELLQEDLLIPATRFFRDPEVFESLKQRVLSPLVKQRRGPNRPIRLWSVGCSTGEETYSLAIIALESVRGHDCQAQIFGTDLKESAVRVARAGRYGPDLARDVSPARLQRFFAKLGTDGESGYQVAKALRDLCVFAHHGITRDPPFSRMDVICCRNVLIYMEPALQRRLFPILHYALNPGGVLVLGSAESASAAADYFRPAGQTAAERKLKFFSKLPNSRIPPFDLGTLRSLGRESSGVALAPAKPRQETDAVLQEADRIVLNQFAPAGAVVDLKLEIKEFRGPVSAFLRPAPGAASLNLMRMARSELGVWVRGAVHKAHKEREPVFQPGLLLSSGREPQRELDLHVIPLGAGADHEELFLVLFQNPVTPSAQPVSAKGRVEAEIQRLRRRFNESQAVIRTLSDENQAARQEHQAAGEELASANEELQSTNEELETSKEELQSANEEITTINEELRHRNAELQASNSDLQNLIALPDFKIMLLDRELRLRRFSPAAEDAFHLIGSDLGRRLHDVRSWLPMAELEKMVVTALTTRGQQRRDIQDDEGRWQELRVSPYLDSDNEIGGAVVSLIDLFDSRNAALQARIAEVAEAVTAAAINPLAVFNRNLVLVRANSAFHEQFRQFDPASVRAAAELLAEHAKNKEVPVELPGRQATLRRLPSLDHEYVLLLSVQG